MNAKQVYKRKLMGICKRQEFNTYPTGRVDLFIGKFGKQVLVSY